MPVPARSSSEKRYGSETPRLWTKPRRKLTPKTTRGYEVIEFAETVLRISLHPWQKWWLIHALELNEDGSYRFRTLILLVARQNGKTTLIQVLALWRMYLDGSSLVLGTAQSLDTAEECWDGAVQMAQGVDELREEIAQVVQVNGKKSLKLVTGERYKVQAANRRGGRGLSGDTVILDELREHQTWEAWGAITKTTMAKEFALIIGASNAGDATSVVLSHVRKIAIDSIADPETSIGIFEWSAPEDCPIDDWDAIAMANPSLGYTITERAIRDAMTDPEGIFRTEVLCQWVENVQAGPIPSGSWDSRLDRESQIPKDSPIAFAVDTSWDRQTTWVAVAGYRTDGTPHVELVASHYGSSWVRPWLVERLAKYQPVAVALQGSGAPVSTLTDELLDSPVSDVLLQVNGQDLAVACGSLYDAVVNGPFAHIGQEQLDEAIVRAVARPMGDAWVLDRKASPVDIAPLVAAALALHALNVSKKPIKKRSRVVGW